MSRTHATGTRFLGPGRHDEQGDQMHPAVNPPAKANLHPAELTLDVMEHSLKPIMQK
jgi:hypothetical protein